MKPTIVLFTLLTLFLPCSYAQMGKDSLITALQQARSDTERITLNLLLSENCRINSSESR